MEGDLGSASSEVRGWQKNPGVETPLQARPACTSLFLPLGPENSGGGVPIRPHGVRFPSLPEQSGPGLTAERPLQVLLLSVSPCPNCNETSIVPRISPTWPGQGQAPRVGMRLRPSRSPQQLAQEGPVPAQPPAASSIWDVPRTADAVRDAKHRTQVVLVLTGAGDL